MGKQFLSQQSDIFYFLKNDVYWIVESYLFNPIPHPMKIRGIPTSETQIYKVCTSLDYL
jgi:hypothetical protein